MKGALSFGGFDSIPLPCLLVTIARKRQMLTVSFAFFDVFVV
jgi:hypothetical protein